MAGELFRPIFAPEGLRDAVSGLSEEAARHVHKGATSQDITDTVAMLLCRRVLDLILAETDGLAAACASLAETHRGTLMAGRTLLQQALPTTFGIKAAGWLVSPRSLVGQQGRWRRWVATARGYSPSSRGS